MSGSVSRPRIGLEKPQTPVEEELVFNEHPTMRVKNKDRDLGLEFHFMYAVGEAGIIPIWLWLERLRPASSSSAGVCLP